MPNLKVLGLGLNFKTIIKWKKQKNIQARNSNGLRNIVLPNIRQVVEHWLLRHPEHADNPERSLVLAKSDGARCPFGFLDQRAA